MGDGRTDLPEHRLCPTVDVGHRAPMNFSVKPTLTGRKTVLRPFGEADAEVM